MEGETVHAQTDRAGVRPARIPVLFAFLAVLLPLFFLPNIPLTLADISTIAPAALALLLCVYGAAGLLRQGGIRVPHVRPLLFFYAVPAAALVEILWSVSRHASFLGFNGETGSILALASAAIFAAAGFTLLRGRRGFSALFFLSLVSAGVSLAVLVLIFGRAAFGQATSLPAGPDEAFFAGLSAVLMVAMAAWAPLGRARFALWAAAFVPLALLLLVPAMGPRIALGAALLLCIFINRRARGSDENAAGIALPAALLAVLVIGSFAAGAFLPRVGIPTGPSAGQIATAQIGELIHSPARAVIGAGPNTYPYVWNEFGPATPDGSTFETGAGLYDTLLATEGVFGFAPLLLFLLAFCAAGLSLVRGSSFTARISFCGALYGWLDFIFQYPNSIALTLTALLSGLALSYAAHIRAEGSIVRRARLWGFILLALCAAGAVMLLLQERAVVQYQAGLSALLDSSDLAQSQLQFSGAIRSLPQAVYYRALAEVQEREVLVLLNTPNDPKHPVDPAQLSQAVGVFSKGAVENAASAIAAEPDNYLNYVVLGNAYGQLATLHVVGALEQGKAAYEHAQALAPQNPLPLVLEASLLRATGSPGPAQTLLYEAAQRSPQFTLPQSYEAAKGYVPTNGAASGQ